MADATAEAKDLPLQVASDRRLPLEFHCPGPPADGGPLASRELDDALGLTAAAAAALSGRDLPRHAPTTLRRLRSVGG
jgi:hypothetical protein